MVSRNKKNRKKRGHVSAGHGRIGMFVIVSNITLSFVFEDSRFARRRFREMFEVLVFRRRLFVFSELTHTNSQQQVNTENILVDVVTLEVSIITVFCSISTIRVISERSVCDGSI